MKIQRIVVERLEAWKNATGRKPLVLKGVRQVGKTWLLKEFGKNSVGSYAYFNFEEQPELKQFFVTTKDVNRIIHNLSLVHGKTIEPGRTLIILDEIQECNEALNSLKYFCENAPEHLVACAGSLLGVAMSRGASFPVGKVDFLDLYPLTFSEFLSAANPALKVYTDQLNTLDPIPDYFFSQLTDALKLYFISGGLPEAVVALLEKQDTGLCQQVLSNILNAYMFDFSKHADNKDVPKIGYVWSSLPSQLSRENKKFLYQTVKPGARAREYENALNWLLQAGLVYKIYLSKKPALPLPAYDDLSSFKLYLADTGLLRRLSMLDPVAIKEGHRLFTEFKGSLSENFILQSLRTQYEVMPRYWSSEGKAEIDFLIQRQNDLIPVEVKSDVNIRGKSLARYNTLFQPRIRLRYSLQNLKYDDGLLNIPLFLADYTEKLIGVRNVTRDA
jgi:predicted AAA+ superfamily ATPase